MRFDVLALAVVGLAAFTHAQNVFQPPTFLGNENAPFNCLSTDTEFNIKRPAQPVAKMVYDDSMTPGSKGSFNIPVEEKGIVFRDFDQSILECNSHYLAIDLAQAEFDTLASAPLSEAQRLQTIDAAFIKMMDDSGAYPAVRPAIMNDVDVGGTETLDTNDDALSTDANSCASYYWASVAIDQFTSEPAYTSTQAQNLAPAGTLDDQKKYYGFVLRCNIYDSSTVEGKISYLRKDFVGLIGLPADFEVSAEYVLTSDVDVLAWDRPTSGDAATTTVDDLTKLFTISMGVEEYSGVDQDNTLYWGEAFKFTWDIDDKDVLDYAHLEKLLALKVDWFYTDATGTRQQGNAGLGYSYFDLSNGNDDPLPYCLDNIQDWSGYTTADTYEASAFAKGKIPVFPTRLDNKGEWKLTLLLPPQMFVDSEEQRAAGYGGEIDVVISIKAVLALYDTNGLDYSPPRLYGDGSGVDYHSTVVPEVDAADAGDTYAVVTDPSVNGQRRRAEAPEITEQLLKQLDNGFDASQSFRISLGGRKLKDDIAAADTSVHIAATGIHGSASSVTMSLATLGLVLVAGMLTM